ncbi:Ypt/Rab-GAP domain of gyp1p superfamily protein [Euphorbia peplus]|nr:Ypt/Rab-GAP domain of gyp1p superfamily protein [Euphorbia peplus]
MPAAAIEQAMPESACLTNGGEIRRRFSNLRGVEWRIDLGILPSPSSSTVDDLRRVTANSRRRYAGIRRRLLVDPHLRKEGTNSPNLAIDNPLSQNPDSTWGRYFRNAELEKTVDQDLSRLYPEHWSYFQTPACQGMLRRILLLWCLRHPECGYRQGMHELLAPLLYVLHVDVEHLSEVRKQYEDHFTDKFDGLPFQENDLMYNFDFKKYLDSMEDEISSHGNASSKVKSLDDLDPEIQSVVLLSDAYGAEGELGIVLSEKFLEHDAYCMFDALMNGSNGVVALADFFSPSVPSGSYSGLPPVIEASAALYHLLSVVDSSLHSHLVELGVEPQYFSLRWLRVLFGREFSLQNLLIVWDEIFAASNDKLGFGMENDADSTFCLFTSPRGAFIAAIAVSIILYLRSSLLATENATTCLQRLLNFPENIDLNKLMDKAKSLQALALGRSFLSLPPPLDGAYNHSKSGVYNHSKSMMVRGHTLSFDAISPRTPLNVVPDSYWEEKWRVMQKAEEERKHSKSEKPNQTRKKGWSEKVKWTLSRTESDPCPTKVGSGKKDYKPSTRRRLLDDLSRTLGLEEDTEKAVGDEVLNHKNDICPEVEVEEEDRESVIKDCAFTGEERSPSGNAGSEENLSVYSYPPSPLSGANNLENDLEKSSVASNLSIYETDDQPEAIRETDDHADAILEDGNLPVSQLPFNTLLKPVINTEPTGKSATLSKERKLLSGKFQWFWRFGRSSVGEETSGGNVAPEPVKSSESVSSQNSSMCSADDGFSKAITKGDVVDQNMMGTLRNLGNSMLEHIQVIESVFQQDRGQENFSKNVIVGKGQVTAISALTELRKISNLLSEM